MNRRLELIALNSAGVVFGILILIWCFYNFGNGHTFLALVLAVVFLAIVYFMITINMRMLQAPAKVSYNEEDLKTLQDYYDLLASLDEKCFKEQIAQSEKQLERLDEKQKTIEKALKDQFGGSQITYAKYEATVQRLIGVYLDNLKKEIARINLFDMQGYEKVIRDHQEYTDAFIPYRESIEYVNGKIEENEKILSSLDDLIIELHKLDDSGKKIEDTAAYQDIEELINNTKLYKH